MTRVSSHYVRRSRVRLAVGLWILLAIVVFNVRFDWQARAANREFVRTQLIKVKQGQPLPTINDGYRPMVRDAAREAAMWMLLIAMAGGGTTLAAAAYEKQAS